MEDLDALIAEMRRRWGHLNAPTINPRDYEEFVRLLRERPPDGSD